MNNPFTEKKPHALIASTSEMITFPIISILLLITFSYQKIALHYNLSVYDIPVPDTLLGLQETITTKILPTVATALVWAFIGAIVYVLSWVSIDTLIRASDARSFTHRFMYPNQDSKRLFLFTIFGQLYIRAMATLLLIGWIFLLFKLVPGLLDMFYGMNFSAKSLVAVVGLASYLFLAAPICRLIVLRPRVFSDTE